MTSEIKYQRQWSKMSNRQFHRRYIEGSSIPVIKDRILRLLGTAENNRLKRSQLTQKLANLGSIDSANRARALLELAVAGSIHHEIFWNNGHPCEMWMLTQLQRSKPPTTGS
jgi:hypothetical protein